MEHGIDRTGGRRGPAAVSSPPLSGGRPAAWRGCQRPITAVGVALVVGVLVVGAVARVGRAADPFHGADPVWSLLHEPAMARELALSASQQRQFQTLLDEYDARFFPLRNRSGDDAASLVESTVKDLLERVQGIFDARQWRRFTEIRTRVYGTTAVLRPMLADRLDLGGDRRERIEEVIRGTARAVAELERRAADGEPRGPLETRYAQLRKDEMRDVTALLSPAQQSAWLRALWRDFDLGSLGQPVYHAPELIDSGHWVGGDPVSLAALAGKVVARWRATPVFGFRC